MKQIEEGTIEKKIHWSLLMGGAEFIQFFAALAIFHKDDLKSRMNSSFSSNHPGMQFIPFFNLS